jgi:hypothetical protein
MSYRCRKKKLLSAKILQSNFFAEMRGFFGFKKQRFTQLNRNFSMGKLF